jgi:signal transduction histidine kinase
MVQDQDAVELQSSIQELHRESFGFLELVSGIILSAWFVWSVLSMSFFAYPASYWVGMGLLAVSIGAGHLLKLRHLKAASYVLIWGIMGTIATILIASSTPMTGILFVIPILFAGAMLPGPVVFFMAGAASLVMILVSLSGKYPPAGGMSIPLTVMMVTGILLLTAVTAWGAFRSLQVALAWVWHAYHRAYENEQMARSSRAELARVMRSLDNAFYSLERTNYKLMLARNQAEEARRLKQQFVQTISHELRTPLNLIVSFSELMTQSPEYYGGPPPFPYMRDLAIVYRNARHLQSLVNDVLDLARIEAARMIILPEEVSPAALTKDALETVRSLVESNGLSLAMDIEAGLPSLWIDPTRIRQVLYNLINNAVRFTEKGGITVSVYRENDDVIFCVRDTGVGIKQEDIPRIFEEFQQIDGGTRRRHEGAGLGLVISKRFVELHGGHIWVESEPGKGSAFYFSLPINIATDENALSLPSASPTQQYVPDLHDYPVLLVVTHSPLAASLFTRRIQRCRTIVVQSLDQAGKAVRQSMPQAVIIDSVSFPAAPPDAEALANAWGLQRTPVMICPLPQRKSLHDESAVQGYLFRSMTRQNLADVMRPLGERLDRVLIVDSDQDFVLFLSRLLEDNPIRRHFVQSACSASEAFQIIRQRPPDLIFLELQLPDIPGDEFVTRLRSNSRWREIPIIVIIEPEALDEAEIGPGAMVIAKAAGLMPGEIVAWVQRTLDAAVAPASSSR